MADTMPLSTSDEDINVIRWKEKRRLLQEISDLDFKTLTCATLRKLLDDRGLAVTKATTIAAASVYGNPLLNGMSSSPLAELPEAAGPARGAV